MWFYAINIAISNVSLVFIANACKWHWPVLLTVFWTSRISQYWGMDALTLQTDYYSRSNLHSTFFIPLSFLRVLHFKPPLLAACFHFFYSFFFVVLLNICSFAHLELIRNILLFPFVTSSQFHNWVIIGLLTQLLFFPNLFLALCWIRWS